MPYRYTYEESPKAKHRGRATAFDLFDAGDRNIAVKRFGLVDFQERYFGVIEILEPGDSMSSPIDDSRVVERGYVRKPRPNADWLERPYTEVV